MDLSSTKMYPPPYIKSVYNVSPTTRTKNFCDFELQILVQNLSKFPQVT